MPLINPNDPVFPHLIWEEVSVNRGDNKIAHFTSAKHPGMSIRMQLAAMAMQGMLANGLRTDQGVEPFYCKQPIELAGLAITYADALIEELNKEK